MKRWYDEMHAEEVAWRRKVLEERIAAFSAWVLPGGVAPTLETLPSSEALAKVRAFVQSGTDEQGLVLLGEGASARPPCCWCSCGAWLSAGSSSARSCDW